MKEKLKLCTSLFSLSSSLSFSPTSHSCRTHSLDFCGVYTHSVLLHTFTTSPCLSHSNVSMLPKVLYVPFIHLFNNVHSCYVVIALAGSENPGCHLFELGSLVSCSSLIFYLCYICFCLISVIVLGISFVHWRVITHYSTHSIINWVVPALNADWLTTGMTKHVFLLL